MSPSLWWGNGIIFRHTKKLSGDLQIWLDMGTREYDPEYESKENNENMRDVRKLKNILLQRGYVEGKNLGYYEHMNAKHSEFYWGERLHLSLLFFFSK
jgi:predicted alpha/beta superfamily hydrolase